MIPTPTYILSDDEYENREKFFDEDIYLHEPSHLVLPPGPWVGFLIKG